MSIPECMADEEKRRAIRNCTSTQKGIDLIVSHGNQTAERINPLYFVPAIEIDNVSAYDLIDLIYFH